MKYASIAFALTFAAASFSFATVTPSLAGCTTNFKFGVCETVKGRNNGAANDAREKAREDAQK